jgi:hypothetical protein
VNLTGGRTRDGGSIVGTSVFYSDASASGDSLNDELGVEALPEGQPSAPAAGAPPDPSSSNAKSDRRTTGSPNNPDDPVSMLDKELREKERNFIEWEETEKQLSSLVWICTSTHASSRVTVIDANNPADVLESFTVCSSHLLCIASVPGLFEARTKK